MRGDDRHDSGEPVVQPPLARGLDPERAIIRLQQGAPVGNLQVQFGQRERLLAAGEQQRIERAEAQLAAAVTSIQPRLDQYDPPDAGKPEAIDQLDFGAFDSEIGMLGITNHDIRQHLPPRPDPLNPVSRRNSAARQFASDYVVGNPLALGPQDRNRQRQNQREDRQNPAQPTQSPLPFARGLVGGGAIQDLAGRGFTRRGGGIDDISHSPPHLRGSPAKAMLGR